VPFAADEGVERCRWRRVYRGLAINHTRICGRKGEYTGVQER
jgi:hypothetical protein